MACHSSGLKRNIRYQTQASRCTTHNSHGGTHEKQIVDHNQLTTMTED